jgi:hypothetical protein
MFIHFICHDCKIIKEVGKWSWEATEERLKRLRYEHKGHNTKEAEEMGEDLKEIYFNYKYEQIW